MLLSAGTSLLRRYRRRLIYIFGICLLLLLTSQISASIVALFDIETAAGDESGIRTVLSLAMVLYVLLMVIPFVPSFEVGLAILMLAAPEAALHVYGCTVLGLGLAFLVGFYLPQSVLTALLQRLHLRRASRLCRTLEPLETRGRLSFLVSRTPGTVIPFALRHRYLALALAINTPGNALIGGGGGIAMLAGLSKLYSLPGFLIIIAIAVSPLPLAVFFFGHEILH